MAQTKKEMQSLLQAAGINPLKRYGQHFLIDGNLLRKLVASAGLTREDVVLEVGPGTGTLTEELLAAAGHVVAVEIDNGLAAICRARFGQSPRFTLLHRDVLERKSRIAPAVLAELARQREELAGAGWHGQAQPYSAELARGEERHTEAQPDPGTEADDRTAEARPRPPRFEAKAASRPPHSTGRAMLVANLPYQVATPLVMELLLGDMRVSPLCVTVQAEVADRLAAVSGGKEYGPITIFAQALASVQRIARLPPKAFWPAPQVDSAMLRLDLRNDAPPAQIKRELSRLVHGCFNHRRKTLRHNLRELLNAEQYDRVETDGRWDLNDRPERITVEQWVELARLFMPQPEDGAMER